MSATFDPAGIVMDVFPHWINNGPIFRLPVCVPTEIFGHALAISFKHFRKLSMETTSKLYAVPPPEYILPVHPG